MSHITESPILAFLVLLMSAQFGGMLFAFFKQPPVVGEILGGLIWGPSFFGVLGPEFASGVFHFGDGRVPEFLKSIGLQFLMFYSGMELKSLLNRDQRRAIIGFTALGGVLPVLVTVAVLSLFPVTVFLGPKANVWSLNLCIAVGVAVTSIPVLSRIFSDLNIMRTSFASLILGTSVIQDLILYVILAIALNLAQGNVNQDQLGMDVAGHIVVNLLFVFFVLTWGGKAIAFLRNTVFSAAYRYNSVATMIITMIGFSLVSKILGVPEFLGALIGGIAMARSGLDRNRDLEKIKEFSNSFFVPVYFALVGYELNLRLFDALPFVLFFAFAFIIKFSGVYAGAHILGYRGQMAKTIAMAMNARGGPGIVLAMVAFEAGIINGSFYTTLILTVIVTSMIAGKYVAEYVSKDSSLRKEVASCKDFALS